MSTVFPIFSILLFISAHNTGGINARPTLDHAPISSRQLGIPAGATITVFNHTSCGRSHVHVEQDLTFLYGFMKPTTLITQSYVLSRDLSPEEQLDWSKPYPPGTAQAGAIPEDCGKFLRTTSPDLKNNPLNQGTCYVMTNGATCVSLWNHKWSASYDYDTWSESVVVEKHF